jgi:hypothetical protein
MLLAHVAQIWNVFISEKNLEEDGSLTLMPNITDVTNSVFFLQVLAAVINKLCHISALFKKNA